MPWDTVFAVTIDRIDAIRVTCARPGNAIPSLWVTDLSLGTRTIARNIARDTKLANGRERRRVAKLPLGTVAVSAGAQRRRDAKSYFTDLAAWTTRATKSLFDTNFGYNITY